MHLKVITQKDTKNATKRRYCKKIKNKRKFDNKWLSSDYLQKHLNILDFNKIKPKFRWSKTSEFSTEK